MILNKQISHALNLLIFRSDYSTHIITDWNFTQYASSLKLVLAWFNASQLFRNIEHHSAEEMG